MELHLAIKNILKYQGQDFLLDAKMINALVDFQAYELHPAMRNIYRTLHSEGYVKKISQANAWDSSCDQLVYEVERDYAFPRDMVEYIFKSIAFGVGTLKTISAPTGNGSQSSAPKPCPSSKPWNKMSKDEKRRYLNSLVEVKRQMFNNYGIKIDGYSIIPEDNPYISVVVQISGDLKRVEDTLEVVVVVYDNNMQIRSSNRVTDLYKNEYNGFLTDQCFYNPECALSDISKIVIYPKIQ